MPWPLFTALLTYYIFAYVITSVSFNRTEICGAVLMDLANIKAALNIYMRNEMNEPRGEPLGLWRKLFRQTIETWESMLP